MRGSTHGLEGILVFFGAFTNRDVLTRRLLKHPVRGQSNGE